MVLRNYHYRAQKLDDPLHRYIILRHPYARCVPENVWLHLLPDRLVNRTQAQGTGQSISLQYLCGERLLIDQLPDFDSEDSFQQSQGAWCVEVRKCPP